MAGKRIVIVGVGGLGVPALSALARSGVEFRTIGLVDPDPVELSNLARQVIYRDSDIGTPKVAAAARFLEAALPKTGIELHRCKLDSSNAAALIAAFDFVIDATDEPAAKFLINDTCCAIHRPFVYGGVLGLAGQAMTVLPGRTACLRCLFEAPPDAGEIASCRAAGIVGPVAGAIGEIQAAEALSFVRDQIPRLAGGMLTYDGGSGRVRIAKVQARRSCECGAWRAANLSAAHVSAG